MAHRLFKLYVDKLQLTVAFCLSEGENVRFYPFFFSRSLGSCCTLLIQHPMEDSIGLLRCIR